MKRGVLERAVRVGECLIVPVHVGSHGYGKITDKLAHRWTWEKAYGPIPAGMTIDHICHNEALTRGECAGGYSCIHRACVELSHLEMKDRVENWRAAGSPGVPSIRRAKAHCPQGHPYSGDNLYVGSTGWRRCRTCHRIQERIRKENNTQESVGWVPQLAVTQ